jgi:hypothetical protein
VTLRLRTSKIVLAITVKEACLGETPTHWRKTNQSALTGREKKQGNRHHADNISSRWTLAGLTLGLIATVGWIGLLGFVAIKLF